MAGVLGAASIPFIACVSLLVAMILQILSFASPYWARNSDNDLDFGLWRKTWCAPSPALVADEEGCWRQNEWDFIDWLDACRGLESLTIIFWAIPLVVLPVYIYVALGLYYRCILVTMTVFTLLGSISNIVGVIVFGSKIADKSSWTVGWCLIVCAIACGFGIIAFVVLLVAACNRPKFEPDRHFVSGFYVDPDRNRMYVVENVEVIHKDPTIIQGHVNPALNVQ